MAYQEPANRPRTSSDLPRALLRGFGAVVVGLTIIAIISLVYALNRGPIERKTGAGPSTTQSA